MAAGPGRDGTGLDAGVLQDVPEPGAFADPLVRVTARLQSTQAGATWAMPMPRLAATCWTALTTGSSRGEEVAEAYRAMDGRRAIKVLLQP